MKIGRYIAVVIIAAIGMNNLQTEKNISYEPNCKKEYIDVKVINETPEVLPKTVRTADGCSLDISFTKEQARNYYTYPVEQRSVFYIKAKQAGEFTTVFSMYRKEEADKNSNQLFLLDKYSFYQNSVDNNCLNYDEQIFCFEEEHATIIKELNEPKMFKAVTDTANNVKELKEIYGI